MDYLNKIITTVSTVKTSVNYALPGNIITKEYDVLNQISSAGPGLLWKVFSGSKKSTKKEVSVWIFEKKCLEMISSKRDRDAVYETLKNGISQLTRLRHPMLLQMEHTLEESRDCLAFCTEPIFSSLANVLGLNDNLTPMLVDQFKNYALEQIEVQHGLSEMADALKFLHVDAKILHRNICPESVIITKSLCWKLAGFDFSTSCNVPSSDQHVKYPVFVFDTHVTPCAQPPVNYLAPECFSDSKECDSYSDIFSMGVLIYSIFNNGRSLLADKSNGENLKNNISKLKSLPPSVLARIPESLEEDLKLCLNLKPELRPDAMQFAKISYLINDNVKHLYQLETMCQFDGPQKVHFLKMIYAKLDQYSQKILTRKILSFVGEELNTIEIIPVVLPILLYIGEKMDANSFTDQLLPILSPVFSVQTPYQVPALLMQKMPIFLSKSSPTDIRTLIVPMMYASLESNVIQLQEPCLNVLPNVVQLMDSATVKNQFLPKILQLATEVTVISVKVNALLCLGQMMEKLERWMATEQVLPVLSKISSKEPAVLMTVLGIFKICFVSKKLDLTKEACAKYCLPFLISNCIESSLNGKQFDKFMSLIKDMLNKVETEQRQRLQQFADSDETLDPGLHSSSIATDPAVQKLKSVQSLSSPSSHISPRPANNSQQKALSLKEKKRLAAQQDVPKNESLVNGLVLQPIKMSASSSSSGIITSERDVSFKLTGHISAKGINDQIDSRKHAQSSNQITLQYPSPNPVVSSKCSNDDWSKFLNENLITDASKSKQTRSPNSSSSKNPFDDLVVFPNTGKRRTPKPGENEVSSDLKDLLG